MSTTLPDAILKALKQAPDYSARFTARVAELAGEVESVLSAPVTHDADMNYRHGQSLSFLSVDSVELRTDDYRHPIEARLYVSSRADLFAFYCFDVKHAYLPPGGRNHPVPFELLPSFARRDIDRCRQVMARYAYAEVSPALFNEPAPGCSTTMDALPANVFAALFAEIV